MHFFCVNLFLNFSRDGLQFVKEPTYKDLINQKNIYAFFFHFEEKKTFFETIRSKTYFLTDWENIFKCNINIMPLIYSGNV